MVIYLWVGVFSVLAPSQVWTLANQVMTTREAKRSFGFIGSGAILGWIVGGLVTRTGVSRFGTENMLAFVAVALLTCAGIVMLIWRARPSYVGNDMPASGLERDTFPLQGAFRLVRESPYLRAIAALILISALATTVAGWQFKAIAKAAVPDTDDLAMFFGTFNMIAGLMSLVLQLLLTGRVLRTLGVGPALFIVPTAMMLGSIGVLVLGSIVAAATLKASDQVLRYSIDKATVELLYLPVPSAHTFRVKSFIDTVVYRLGDAGGGLVVLLFAAVLGWSPARVSIVGIVLVGAWMVAAYVAQTSVRREPPREHSPAPRRSRARLDAGDGPRHHAADLVAAQRQHARDCLRAQPVRDGARPQGAPGRSRAAEPRAGRDSPAGHPPPGARRRRHA